MRRREEGATALIIFSNALLMTGQAVPDGGHPPRPAGVTEWPVGTVSVASVRQCGRCPRVRVERRPRQVFAHGAFTHTTAVQSIESGFSYAYDCKGVGTRPRTGSGVLMERSGAEESRWHEVDVKPRRVGTASRPESAE